MLKNNFAAAINAREPLEQIQDVGADNATDPGAQGNAFAGSRANADHEMYNAIHGAIMDGDAGNSSIANAGMRLSAKFGSATTKSDKDAEKSRAVYMQVMNQQLQKMRDDLEATLNSMREKYDEMDEQLHSLSKLRELVNDGNFDPTNPEHVTLYNEAFNNDPEMSAEEFALETQSGQNDIIDGTESDVQAKQVELERDIAEMEEKWDQTIEIDPNGEDPDVISQRVASFEEYATAMNEKYQLEADNVSESQPAPQNTMASNFSF